VLTGDLRTRPVILLKCGASLLALGAVTVATPVWAQDEDAETPISASTDVAESSDDDIIITGIRQSLATSQNIKRESDTVVDAITAQDIGALPDRSVTEALQRVPGVSINRFAGSNDPDHFSVEGSGVAVRGLTFVRSEFNGRDTFSTGVYGQAINFADVPAELLGGVEVFKNSTAELIEGGLSGTVNMKLRVPFDNKGFHIGFDFEANYSDLANEWSPLGSLLISNTWDTDMGRIGLLVAGSYSQVKSRADGVQVTNFQTRDGIIVPGSNNSGPICRHPLPADTDTEGFPPGIAGGVLGDECYGPAPAGADGFADFADTRFAPLGAQFRTQDFDRKRDGIAVAAQWESLDRRALVTAQFLRSHASQKWGEHTIEAGPDLSEYNTFPAGCLPNTAGANGQTRAQCPVGQFTNYQYDEDGIFESGFITVPLGGWRGNETGNPDRVPQGGMQHSLARRQVDDDNVVADYGLNFKFAPTDRWSINLDAQRVDATHDNLDFSVFGSIFADQELDLTGGTPEMILHKPLILSQTWATPTDRLRNVSDEDYFLDPHHTFWRAAMDHFEKSRGDEWAFRGDVAYNFPEDSGFLRRAKFGARYADRDQSIRFTTYNWGSLSEVWSGRAIFMDEVGGPNVETYDFDGFFRGDTAQPPVANYYAGDLIDDYQGSIDFFQSIQEAARAAGGGGATSWNPLAERAGVVAGTMFLPSEIQEVEEKRKAAYAMLSFGSDEPMFGNVKFEGNIGIRYVDAKLASLGSIGVPSQQAIGVNLPFDVRCAPVIPPPPLPPVPVTPGGICNLGEAGYEALQAWATGETNPDDARHKYDYWLPSINLKFGLTNEIILRFAASKNLAYPEMANIRNFLTIGFDNDALRLTATAGNPFLKPATSDNYDASLEWYFSQDVGSLVLNAFYKKIKNFFFQDVFERDIVSNGVTQTVLVRGPANSPESGTVKGFEIGYQQTYDFLPGFLSGLGINANYTYIKSKGLPNSRLNLGVPVNNAPIGVADNLPLEQLSKHNFNITGFYEKGPVSLRVAYNWRSEFLLTSADVIFPYFPIFNDDTGQLDASLFYSVTPNIKVGVQAVNLLNETTKTLQQFTLDGLKGPRSYFINDRRFSFIVRGSF
jgi:TonB-dependent receptor